MANDVFAALAKKTENKSSTAVKGLAEMFGLDDNLRTVTLPIAKLREKKNHPFKVVDDDKLLALADSIKKEGLVQPVIVRRLTDGNYEILSGHRRTRACLKNNMAEINAIVVDVDDELANRIMIVTNFQQRDMQCPSEIAKSYAIRYNDLKNRPRRQEENSTGWNSDKDKIDKIMEKEFSTSKSKIYMYLRLNHLYDKILDALDNKKLNLKVATELSYLIESEQTIVYELAYKLQQYRIDRKKAVNLKKASAERELNEDDIREILSNDVIKEKGALFISSTEMKRYQTKFESSEDMKKAIISFLENY